MNPLSPVQTPVVSPAPVSTAAAVQPELPAGAFTLGVDSLSPGAALPDRYTCTGASESPAVSWSGIPAGSKSLVLILDDPDAPAGTFTHWLVYNIPPASGKLAQGQQPVKVLADGAQQGVGSSGSRGYYPPCPPIGPAHRYIFHLFALDIYPDLPTADRAAIDDTMVGHILGEARVVTTFKR